MKVLEFRPQRKKLVKRTLESGGYEADFYLDSSIDPPIYHYIITKNGSSTIVAWGQEKTAQDAEQAAMECMHDLYQHSLNLGVSAAG